MRDSCAACDSHEATCMKLSLAVVASLSLLVACGSSSSDAAAPAAAESDFSGTAGTPAARVAALIALTPITQPTHGILPAGESERRWARSGGSFTQGLWAGRDDDGNTCTVHAIHYVYRDGGRAAFLQAWRDDRARYRRYNEDFDTNVSGVEQGIVLAENGPHLVSLTDDPSPGDDVRKFAAQDASLNLTVHMLVKNSHEDWRDVEIELADFSKPGGGVVIRIKKFGSDDVVRCHGLVPKKGPTDG